MKIFNLLVILSLINTCKAQLKRDCDIPLLSIITIDSCEYKITTDKALIESNINSLIEKKIIESNDSFGEDNYFSPIGIEEDELNDFHSFVFHAFQSDSSSSVFYFVVNESEGNIKSKNLCGFIEIKKNNKKKIKVPKMLLSPIFSRKNNDVLRVTSNYYVYGFKSHILISKRKFVP